ncbi:MAG: hypothetical protein IKR36_06685 [Clostridia bacterium]|nr:hypothetical protein [Clostridia bacterium]
MKKIVCLALVLIMALSMMGIASAEGETLKLTVLGRQRSGITFEETQTLHAWQVLCDMFKANNLELEYTVVERDQIASVLNATLAGSDIPDFFYANPLSDADCINLIDRGMMLDINEALKYSKGPAAKEFGEGGLYEISRQIHTYTDGGMYFFGNVSKQISIDTAYGSHAIVGNNCTMLIRQDWLDRLNLPMPKTLEDVVNVLVAFQENDMNGNGIKDERIVIDWDSTFNGVAGWFGLAPQLFQCNRLEKTAVVPELQEGYVPYVKFLQELVDKGLAYLSDEVSYYNGGTSEGDLLNTIMQDDCVAMYYGVALADHTFQSAEAVYTAMPLIQAVEGIEPIMNISHGYKVWSRWGFSAKADPKAVAAFLDTICTQEYAKWVTFGIEGETYEVDPDSGLYTFTASNKYEDIMSTGKARGYMLVIDSFLPDASQIGWYQQYYGPLNWKSYDEFLNSEYCTKTLASQYTENQMKNLKIYCEEAQKALLYNFNNDVGMITPMNTLEEAEVLDMYEADVKTYLKEMTVNFLTGVYDINDYESCVEELNSIGLQDVLAVRQAQYDRYFGK